MFHQKTTQVAKGKWKGILMALGMPDHFLSCKHGPCPLCGGTNRFRWDNQDGRGTYICNQCGAGDGMTLACAFTDKPFAEVAPHIDRILGNVKPDTQSQPDVTPEKIQNALRALYKQSQPVRQGDVVDRYLAARNLDELIYPKALRYAENLRDGEGGVHPCMIALVGRYGERKFDTIHRTFLKRDGSGKAEIESPRKLMPGTVPEGASVMLSDWTESGPLGIAEGIETAMAASAIFDMPVWAALNSSMMKKWLPPPGCAEIVIYGDNDTNFTGQAAAYQLANRLAVKGYPVGPIQFPSRPGDDWADEYLRNSISR
ncbi:DUF7146 domain-containing protein [Roseibaca calidilacus]|uniref:DNA primase/helicase n=1 Tax=Roseibaca calidilacus TaxID=1666912 RepID=A0ABM9VSW7_9RHOB|nr:toprim domain-containing protein [Roseibaca calidilacus]CUX80747.1 putative DNA primase/helicase [Roseibaca calidilacus]